MSLTRRELMSRVGVGGAAVLAGAVAGPLLAADKAVPGAEPAAAPAFAGGHAIAPLPFDAAKLKGISEKLITSHHDNNYAAAVKNLNRLEGELARVDKDTAPFAVGGLKQGELLFANSIILHEHYFANLGGDGKAAGPVADAIAAEWGALARWEALFRATATSLGGGSGWAVLGWNLHTGRLVTTAAINHSQALAFGRPLLVMDMYEHAYQMDYGAAAAKYIDAFFDNVRWDEVNRRFEQARRLAAALKG